MGIEAFSGSIVYLPPEAKDVPVLMAGLVDWVKDAEKEGLPVPLIAAIVHYQSASYRQYIGGLSATGPGRKGASSK